MINANKHYYTITLATAIVAFAKVYDTYDYFDNYSDEESEINELHNVIYDLECGNVGHLKNYFQQFIDELQVDNSAIAIEMANRSKTLKFQLERLALM